MEPNIIVSDALNKGGRMELLHQMYILVLRNEK